MINEFRPKKNIYKIFGEANISTNVSKIQSFLNQVDEVDPLSIRVYGIINRNIKFKFKGTESQLKDLISVITSKLDYKVYKIKKSIILKL